MGSNKHKKGVLYHSLHYKIPLEDVRELAFETIVSRSSDEDLIDAFRSRGISIPLYMYNVLRRHFQSTNIGNWKAVVFLSRKEKL